LNTIQLGGFLLMASSILELRQQFKGFDSRIAALEAGTADQAEPIAAEERQHTAVFAKWLREPADYGIKAELTEIEGDLSGRAVERARQQYLFAQEQAAAARHTLEAAEHPVGTRIKMALLNAERDEIKARVAFEDAEREAKYSHKDITIGTGATGGFAVPKEIAQRIARRTVMLNPFRRLARVDRAGSSDYRVLLDLNNGSGGWIGEVGTRSATSTSQLREIVPSFTELYATLTASEWSLSDIFFDAESWLVNGASDQFSRLEALAVVNGDGVDEIRGFLTTAPSTTADDGSPSRADDQLQHVVATGSPNAPTAGDLADLLDQFGDGYLEAPSAAWIVHRSALALIRKITWPTGYQGFRDSPAAGQPAMLLGLPLFVTAAMDAPGSTGFPISVGDWDLGYVLVDRVGMRVTFDEVSTPGQPRFNLRRRVAGHVADGNAIKLLQF
jgi:HK97 family phage major capsid protein